MTIEHEIFSISVPWHKTYIVRIYVEQKVQRITRPVIKLIDKTFSGCTTLINYDNVFYEAKTNIK